MKEWICREISTTTGDNENGILMMESKLIRCKDCKYWESLDEESYCRELGVFDTSPTSYCSYARGKE